MTYKILTVAEDNYESDRLTAVFPSYGGRFQDPSQMTISVSAYRKVVIKRINQGIVNGSLEFQDLDIDGIIQYLQEVKTFLHEEDMIKVLMGQRKQ